jgi:hypothetical protein
MVALPENGYPVYPNVPANVELQNVPAPETLLPPHTGDPESWKGGPIGLQPGHQIGTVSPMSASFYEAFGDPRANSAD